MENLILENGCLTLVNENGKKQLVMTLGMVVGCLHETASNCEKHGFREIADKQRARASRVMKTPQYQEWVSGSFTIEH